MCTHFLRAPQWAPPLAHATKPTFAQLWNPSTELQSYLLLLSLKIAIVYEINDIYFLGHHWNILK